MSMRLSVRLQTMIHEVSLQAAVGTAIGMGVWRDIAMWADSARCRCPVMHQCQSHVDFRADEGARLVG